MLRTHDAISIRATTERIFDLAVDIECWPLLLPHYRYVRRLPDVGSARAFAMGARQFGLPVRWSATQRSDPVAGTISYHHRAGVTRDMDVVWRLTAREQDVLVTIDHVLTAGWPLVATGVGQLLVGELFVRQIAQRTLRGIRRAAEQGR